MELKSFFFILLFTTTISYSQGIWTYKSSLPGPGRYQAASFVINNKAFIGAGAWTCLNDLWEYDPITNNWTGRTPFPGICRGFTMSFAIGSKGYCGTGSDGMNWLNDFWEYDPSSNAWTQKANFSGGARGTSIGLGIGGKGYVGFGASIIAYNDMWEYDPILNSWSQKNSCPCAPKADIDDAVFVIGGIGYYTHGGFNELWGFDPSSNTWTQFSNFPGLNRYGSVAFSIGCIGYAGLGEMSANWFNDFYMWHQPSNTWVQINNFGGQGTVDASSFSIGNKGYVACGWVSTGYTNDLWEFLPQSICPQLAMWGTTTAASCVGNTGTATINIYSGTPPYTYVWNPSGQTTQTATGLSNGLYTVTVTDAMNLTGSAIVLVYPASLQPSLFSTSSPSDCGGVNNGSASANASNGVPPYTYLWSSGQTTQAITNLAPGTYTVTVTDANGCTNSNVVNVGSIPFPVANITASDTICAGTSIQLAGFFQGAQNYSFLWSTNQTAFGILVTPTATSTYWLIVSNGNCSDTDSITITTINPELLITGDTVICEGESITLTASSGYTFYQWNNGATTSAITVQPSSNTLYSCIAFIQNCTASESINITVNPSPVVTVSNSVIIEPGELVTLTASGGPPYLWSNGETTASITVSPSTGTVFCVTTINSYQCEDSACVRVDLNLGCEPFIPTAFSPDGKGLNETFRIPNNCLSEIHLLIYDRWGEKVFETTDLNFAWDGAFRGQPLDQGVFVYYLKGTLKNGEPYSSKGNITLVR